MDKLVDALRRLVELLVAYLAGRQVQKAETRADVAEGNLDAFKKAQEAADAVRNSPTAERLQRAKSKGRLRDV